MQGYLRSVVLCWQYQQALATVCHPPLQVVPGSSAAAGGRADGAGSPVQPADACSHADLKSSKLRLAGRMGAKKGGISTGQPGRVAEVAAGPDTPSRRSEGLTGSLVLVSGPTLHWQTGVPWDRLAATAATEAPTTGGTGTPRWDLYLGRPLTVACAATLTLTCAVPAPCLRIYPAEAGASAALVAPK